MALVTYALGVSGVLLGFLLLWRIHRERLWRPYPFLSVYVAYVSCVSVLLPAVLQLYGYSSQVYKLLFWGNETVAGSLWVLIFWEIFRHSFPPGLGIRRIVGTAAVLLAAATGGLLLVVHGAIGWPHQLGYAVPNAERYVSLVVAPVILWLLLAAQYYRIPLGRNIWGAAIGFGILLSSTAVELAALLLERSVGNFARIVGPAGFVGMLAVWAWALWRYAPNPRLAPAPAESSELELILWRQEWHRLLTSMRKVFER